MTATRGDQMTAEAQHAREGADSWHAYLSKLEELASELTQQGLRARLVTPPGRIPSLHVVNPAAAALAEDVYAGRSRDGQWWFWWSWAERIASGEDTAGAASRIRRVLAASR
ncbi:MAG TPA: hypothetical protein VMV07_25440 [Streptosporangiaceae bacterium]|nr:hypothetical protein [Streptosporangiaceae bacterium]